MILTLESAVLLANRYADIAEQQMETASEEEKGTYFT